MTMNIGVASRLPSSHGEQLGAVVLLGRGEPALHELHEAVLLVLVVVALALLDQLDGGVDEEGAEDVEDPAELLDRGRADRDEDAAQDDAR